MVRISNKPARNGIKRPLQDDESEEDEVSYQRHKRLLLQEHKKVHPNVQVVLELMKATYTQRHAAIVKGACLVSSTLENFPFLGNFEEV